MSANNKDEGKTKITKQICKEDKTIFFDIEVFDFSKMYPNIVHAVYRDKKSELCELLRRQYKCTCDKTGSNSSVKCNQPMTGMQIMTSDPTRNKDDVCIVIKQILRMFSNEI